MFLGVSLPAVAYQGSSFQAPRRKCFHTIILLVSSFAKPRRTNTFKNLKETCPFSLGDISKSHTEEGARNKALRGTK
jgi:hypothetical protein